MYKGNSLQSGSNSPLITGPLQFFANVDVQTGFPVQMKSGTTASFSKKNCLNNHGFLQAIIETTELCIALQYWRSRFSNHAVKCT